MSWWQARGHARVNPSHPEAFGLCDCCGFLSNLNDLRYQFQWAGTVMQNLHFRVCRTCYDKPSHLNNPYGLPPDPVPVFDPRPWPTSYNFGFINNGGVLQLNPTVTNYPTSPMGLKPGAVWNNGSIVCVTGGVIPSPLFPAVFFGGEIDAQQLLVIGGGNLPIVNPFVATQLWNNGSVICVG